MPASFDPNHITKLQQLYSFITGVWGKCKNLFATKTELQEAIQSIPDPLPEATSADEGKVLKVNANGNPEWSAGGDGGSLPSLEITPSDTIISTEVAEGGSISFKTPLPDYSTDTEPTTKISELVSSGTSDTSFSWNSATEPTAGAYAPMLSGSYGSGKPTGSLAVYNGSISSDKPAHWIMWQGTFGSMSWSMTSTENIESSSIQPANDWRTTTINGNTWQRNGFQVVFGDPTGNFDPSLPIYVGIKDFYGHQVPTGALDGGVWGTNEDWLNQSFLFIGKLDKAVVNLKDEFPTDASDSVPYVRDADGWHKLSASSGISINKYDPYYVIKGPADAPSDGKEYVRKDGAWVENSYKMFTLYSGAATNEVTNLSLNPFDYDEIKLFLKVGTVNSIYSLGIKGNTAPYQHVLKVFYGESNLWERWIQLTFTANSVTVNATKRYKVGTITDTTTTPSDVRYSTAASDLQFISKIIGINY